VSAASWDERRVTCVIPAHDSREWIGEAIESVLAQTYPPAEIIVLDSSDDGAAEVARGYGDLVRPMAIEDRGPAFTRNRGIAAARYELIAFLDGDDRWLPRKLELQVELLTSRPELGGCVTHVQNVWGADVGEEGEHYRGHRRAKPMPGYATISLLARRWAFERVGPLREDLWYADSTDWFLRAEREGVEIALLEEVLVEHRMRAGNLTRRGSEASRSEFLGVLRRRLADRGEAAE
jgi:glycosyltransferase involved in cell wall biosynthesis